MRKKILASEIRIHVAAIADLQRLNSAEQRQVIEFIQNDIANLPRASHAGRALPFDDYRNHMLWLYTLGDLGLEFAICKVKPYYRMLLRVRFRGCKLKSIDAPLIIGSRTINGIYITKAKG